MIRLQISAAQRACEILGDLVAACAVLPRDSLFYLMQSMGHGFTMELPAGHTSLKPSSSHSGTSVRNASSAPAVISCDATVGGFCLMVLRVLCPVLTSAVAFPPRISLKMLLAGQCSPPPLPIVARQRSSHNLLPAVVSTAEFASLSVSASEPDLAPAAAPMLAAATQSSPNTWSCSAVAMAWQRPSGTSHRSNNAHHHRSALTLSAVIIDTLSIRRPDISKSPLARAERQRIAALEKVPEDAAHEQPSPPAQPPPHPQRLEQALLSPPSPSQGSAHITTGSTPP